MRLCASLFRGVAAPLGCVICLQLGDVAVFFTLCAVLSERARWGWYHYSRSVPHVHQHPRAGYQNGKFCRFWALTGCAHKEHREPSGQRCAYARRCSEGVAAPLGCVIFSVSVEIAACMPCAQGLSVCARRGWYHYPRRAPHVLETLDGRLSKGLICHFPRSGNYH